MVMAALENAIGTKIILSCFIVSIYSFLAQLSRCAYTITFRKRYIASLEICTIGPWTVGWLEIWTTALWTVGPFDYILIQMDDYPADSLP